jgi:hypothetical protein
VKLYKIYAGKLTWVNVSRETKCFYFLDSSIPAFGYSSRVEKTDGMLTPQQAILEDINSKKTMRGAFQDKLAKIETELKSLEALSEEHNQSLEPTVKDSSLS